MNNRHDNYSTFLDEYKNSSEIKQRWVDEKLGYVENAIKTVQGEIDPALEKKFDDVLTTLQESHLEGSKKTVVVINQLSNILSQENEIQRSFLNKLKKAIPIFIDIAKVTYDESVAKAIIDFSEIITKKNQE